MNIHPENIVFAREQINLEPEDAAKKLSISQERLIQFETGQRVPTLRQLKKMTDVYKCNLLFLLGPKVKIIGVDVPKDYRKLAHLPYEPLNAAALDAIKTAKARRKILLESLADQNEDISFNHPINTLEAPAIANYLKSNFDIEKIRRETRNIDDFYRQIRLHFEQHNVLIFVIAGVSKNQFAGMALYYSELPIILLNSKLPNESKLFTLFHELTHILLRHSALCGTSFLDEVDQVTEVLCNNVAGTVLVPDEYLLNEDLSTLALISKRAKFLRASCTVVCIRLQKLGLISKEECSYYLSQISQNFRGRETKEKQSNENGPGYYRTLLSHLGKFYTDRVIQSINSGYIPYSDVPLMLNAKVKGLDRIKKELYGS